MTKALDSQTLIILVTFCLYSLQYINELSLTFALVEAVENGKENENVKSYCYNGCSGNGVCNEHYTCVCNPGWHGEDCSIQFSSLLPLSIGDEKIKSFAELKDRIKNGKSNAIVIGVSSSACAKCAVAEEKIYSNLYNELSRQNIKFLRVDASQNPDILSDHRFIPSVVNNDIPSIPFIVACNIDPNRKNDLLCDHVPEKQDVFNDIMSVVHDKLGGLYSIDMKERSLVTYIHQKVLQYSLLKKDDLISSNLIDIEQFIYLVIGVFPTEDADELNERNEYLRLITSPFSTIKSIVSFAEINGEETTRLLLDEYPWMKPESTTRHQAKKGKDAIKQIPKYPWMIILRWPKDLKIEFLEEISLLLQSKSDRLEKKVEINIMKFQDDDFDESAGMLEKYIAKNIFTGDTAALLNVPSFIVAEAIGLPMIIGVMISSSDDTLSTIRANREFLIQNINPFSKSMRDEFRILLHFYQMGNEVSGNDALIHGQLKSLGIFMKYNSLHSSVECDKGRSRILFAINKKKNQVGIFKPFEICTKGDIIAPLRLYIRKFLSNQVEKYDESALRSISAADDVVGVREHFDESKDKITHITSDEMWNKIVLNDENHDIVVIYHEDNDEPSLRAAPSLKRLAKRFTAFADDKIKVYRMDIAYKKPPPHISIEARGNLPILAFYPAHSKRTFALFYSDVMKILPIMQWIEKNSGSGLKLPPLPQFDEKEKELFKEQIAIREKEREKRESQKEL